MRTRMLFLLLPLLSLTLNAQRITYPDNNYPQGFSLERQSIDGVAINYSISEFTLSDISINGEMMKRIELPGHYLPNDEGSPDLPGNGRFIAIPEGATPVLKIEAMTTEIIRGIEIAPAPDIPKVTERGPLVYQKNPDIYSADKFYPENPAALSEIMEIRGVDVVIAGITPFQHNPVTGELRIIRDIRITIDFEGGTGQFGEERLQSRWWDPVIRDAVLNSQSIPRPNRIKSKPNHREDGVEYLIIIPDNPEFRPWADSLKNFRVMQGISTRIVTTGELGGNSSPAIESYIDNAYATWDPAPAAVLLMGDHKSGDDGILSPLYDLYCVSDHMYADVDGDDIEDIILARMTAENTEQLETMVRKAIGYETSPPTDPGFYDHPVTALGWQTSRWFQICSETVGGYFREVRGKQPVRINALYSGDPGVDPWSTAPNTDMVLSYFGPGNLGYIPATPAELGGFSGGTASDVTNALNSGAYLLQHRDHGFEYGWGEPDYGIEHIEDLTNEDLCFVFSINCLTGKYNHPGECFAERFHRYTYDGKPSGALGLLAASEVSYSFVNDVYVWGVFDNMYPDFLPDYGTLPESRGQLPAFGNAAGKFFLMQSGWPYNWEDKEVTYNLFHHHGDAFTCLYSEVPQPLNVAHETVMISYVDVFPVKADEGALVALSAGGEVIGTATGTGEYLDVPIVPQAPPSVVDVVVTKQNYLRYHSEVIVINPSGPYLINAGYAVNDGQGNGNGRLDYGETASLSLSLKNVGLEDAVGIMVTLSGNDEYVTIESQSVSFGSIPSGETSTNSDAFSFTIAGNVPDGHLAGLLLDATDGEHSWQSQVTLEAHAPVLNFIGFEINDAGGNSNGHLDPDEPADIVVLLKNSGSSEAYDVTGWISTESPYVDVVEGESLFGTIAGGDTIRKSFLVETYIATPPGQTAIFGLDFEGMLGIEENAQFETRIGRFPALVVDLDLNHNSGTVMRNTLEQLKVQAGYQTSLPQDPDSYRSIFLCLGIYPNNRVLLPSQGERLARYLQNGGNVYLEGGDTWYYDQQSFPTVLHPMFRIEGTQDGSGNLNILFGEEGSLAEGLAFDYTGENQFIDQLQPMPGAVTVFSNFEPSYACNISYSGDDYKTIGASFEFAGLTDMGENTKRAVMSKYLEFFDIQPITVKPSTPWGPEILCGTGQAGSYNCNPVPNSDCYHWQVFPPGAGIVTGYGESVQVQWSEGFTGLAKICVCGMNSSCLGPVSDTLEVLINELPAATCSLEPAEICPGDTASLSIILTGVSPWTIYLNYNGATVLFNSNKQFFSLPYLSPSQNLVMFIEKVVDGNGCETNEQFETLVLEVIETPLSPQVPSGEIDVDTYLTTTYHYSTGAVQFAENYSWEVNPGNAGAVVSSSDTSCVVEWNPDYTGPAGISVKAMNACGESEFSSPLEVTVGSSFGVPGIGELNSFRIFPNPTKGTIYIKTSPEVKGDISFSLFSPSGETIAGGNLEGANGFYQIDIPGAGAGLYYLRLITDGFVVTGKLVLVK